MSPLDWELYPDAYFAFQGRTLTEMRKVVAALLNAERVNFDELRTQAQRLDALLNHAEGPLDE